jgi:hypothetical protein
MALMQAPQGTPLLAQLSPYHGFERAHQRYVPLSRFHGSQRLNLMRPTRLPASSRRYTHGDPVNLIDWRAYARNEQLVIREQNDEASCRILLVLEESPTLDWPDQALSQSVGRSFCTKRELMWRLSLHIAYQSCKWGDTVRIALVEGNAVRMLAFRSQVDAAIFFDKLQSRRFSLPADAPLEKKTLSALQEERSDLLYWLSDGFQGLPSWLLQKRGPFACWIHILSGMEIDPSWMEAQHCYFDESLTAREYMGSALLQDGCLHHAVMRWQEEISHQWLHHHRHYILASDETPIRAYLMSLEQPWGLGGFQRGGPRG